MSLRQRTIAAMEQYPYPKPNQLDENQVDFRSRPCLLMGSTRTFLYGLLGAPVYPFSWWTAGCRAVHTIEEYMLDPDMWDNQLHSFTAAFIADEWKQLEGGEGLRLPRFSSELTCVAANMVRMSWSGPYLDAMRTEAMDVMLAVGYIEVAIDGEAEVQALLDAHAAQTCADVHTLTASALDMLSNRAGAMRRRAHCALVQLDKDVEAMVASADAFRDQLRCAVCCYGAAAQHVLDAASRSVNADLPLQLLVCTASALIL